MLKCSRDRDGTSMEAVGHRGPEYPPNNLDSCLSACLPISVHDKTVLLKTPYAMVIRYGGIKLELSWKHMLWGLAFKLLGDAVEAAGGERTSRILTKH